MNERELVTAIVDVYDQEAGALRSLLQLAVQSRECLRAGELDRLQEFLDQQQALTALIDRCTETATPLRCKLGETCGLPELTLGALAALKEVPPFLRPVQEAMRRVGALLENLAAVHAENQRSLEERLEAVRTDQAALTRAKTAVRAYRSEATEDSRFVDRRS